MVKRTHWDIKAEIMECILEGPHGITDIIHEVKTVHKYLKKNLENLISAGLIKTKPSNNYPGAFKYYITEKGEEFLKVWKHLMKLTNREGWRIKKGSE